MTHSYQPWVLGTVLWQVGSLVAAKREEKSASMIRSGLLLYKSDNTFQFQFYDCYKFEFS